MKFGVAQFELFVVTIMASVIRHLLGSDNQPECGKQFFQTTNVED
jgi:hypothetical protein